MKKQSKLVNRILFGSFLASVITVSGIMLKNKINYDPTSRQEKRAQINKEKTQKEEKLEDKLKTFKGYEDPVYNQYDEFIIKYTDIWNEEFKDVPNFEPLDPNIPKSMIIQESGSPRDRNGAYKFDPMQIANKGDFALKTLRDGLENSIPENGYEDLQGIEETPGKWVKYIDKKGKKRKKWVWQYKEADNRITAELSIKYGIRWIGQKNLIFDKSGEPCGVRGWEKAAKRYNGSGTPGYAEKILKRLKN